MEAKEVCLIEPLLERVEEYSKTSLKLFKLKSIDKTTDVMSALISRLLFTFVVTFFMFTLTIAVSLWIGDVIGNNYYGFFIVSLFYALVGITTFFIHPWIKAHVKNAIVKQMCN